MMDCGMRPEEAMRMRKEHVFWDRSVVLVPTGRASSQNATCRSATAFANCCACASQVTAHSTGLASRCEDWHLAAYKRSPGEGSLFVPGSSRESSRPGSHPLPRDSMEPDCSEAYGSRVSIRRGLTLLWRSSHAVNGILGSAIESSLDPQEKIITKMFSQNLFGWRD